MKNFEIPSHYRSDFITKIKEERKENDKLKKDDKPTILKYDGVEFYLARHFGFCYGVENAIEIAFRAVNENFNKKIFLLSEIIHNPLVNQDLLDHGVRFIMNTDGTQIIPWDEITEHDIVVVPAFGTTLEIEEILKNKNIEIHRYTSTCPFVEKVWNRAKQVGKQGYSIIIHGKPNHEESKATFSHSKENAPSLIIKNIHEARLLAEYILGNKNIADFEKDFKGYFSSDFNPEIHLQKIGVVNQTTMLATETQEIAEFLKNTLIKKNKNSNLELKDFFADTRDTLCYATNDNQNAVLKLKEYDMDLAFVIGGYNSSNTSHLFELLETSFPTYYIKDENNILSSEKLIHWDFHNNVEKEIENYLLKKNSMKIAITSGASCPDKVVENVINKIQALISQISH